MVVDGRESGHYSSTQWGNTMKMRHFRGKMKLVCGKMKLFQEKMKLFVEK